MSASRPVNPMSALTAVLCILSALVLAPLWAPLVLAAWFADLLGPLARGLRRVLGGRRRAAGALVVLVALGILVPLAAVGLALLTSGQELWGQLRADGHGSIAGALLGEGSVGAHLQPRDWAAIAGRYGENAWGAFAAFARASASAAIATLVFVAALYTFVIDGERAYRWLEANAPVAPAELSRLAGAFRETGRGLLVAGLGTAAIQGALATIAYAAIGLPRAMALGPLTALCALVPVVGTGLVWVPLAIELFARGQYWRGFVVVGMGAGVHSLVDNFVRPALARSGRLELPAFVVLIAMLGGVASFGASGALLGPLVVRLSLEGLSIVAARRDAAAAQAGDAANATGGSDGLPEPEGAGQRDAHAGARATT